MAPTVGMRDSLKPLAECCQDDQRPECPILDELSGHHAAVSRAEASLRRVNHTVSSGNNAHCNSGARPIPVPGGSGITGR